MNTSTNRKDSNQDNEAVIIRVAVLGDVNHGKTSLIDYFSGSDNVSNEPGNITQTLIRKYDKTKKVIFIDTPGHSDFNNMRKTAINLCEIVMIVIAANRDLGPEVKKLLNTMNQDKPIMFVITNIDRENEKKESNYQKLASMGYVSEKIGGDIPTVEVSSITGRDMDELLNYAQILTPPGKPAHSGEPEGIILNVVKNKRFGYKVLITITKGTLNLGDYVYCNGRVGKVKCLFDQDEPAVSVNGNHIVAAVGFNGIPAIGDKFIGTKSKKKANLLAKNNNKIDEMTVNTEANQENERCLALKSDNLLQLEELEEKFKYTHRILFSSIGDLTQHEMSRLKEHRDVKLLCFGGGFSKLNCKQLDDNNISYVQSYVIYDIINATIETITIEELVDVGTAIIIKKFIYGKTAVYGCKIVRGNINTKSYVKVMRNGGIIYDKLIITSLQKEKEKVESSGKGTQCGVMLSHHHSSENKNLKIHCDKKDEIIIYDIHTKTLRK